MRLIGHANKGVKTLKMEKMCMINENKLVYTSTQGRRSWHTLASFQNVLKHSQYLTTYITVRIIEFGKPD